MYSNSYKCRQCGGRGLPFCIHSRHANRRLSASQPCTNCLPPAAPFRHLSRRHHIAATVPGAAGTGAGAGP